MDLKSFIKESNKRIDKLDQEGELVNWVKSYARSLPEKDRNVFLHDLDGSEVSFVDSSVLQNVLSFVSDVKGKGTYLVQRFDDYAEYGYEYDDPSDIFLHVKQYYNYGEDCLYAGEYDIAVKVFTALNNLSFYVKDEDDGLVYDHFSWDDLEWREIYTLDKQHVCAMTLCAHYLASDKDERAEVIAEVLQQDIFRHFSLEQMFMVKHIVLPDTNVFLRELVTVLIDKSGQNAATFFAQAVKLCYSNDEQLQFGLQYASRHPSFLSDQMDILLCDHQFNLVLTYGLQAIGNIPENMEARGEIARMTAVAAYHLGECDAEIKALKAQFVSSCSLYAIYALMTRVKMDNAEVEALLQSARQNSRFESTYDESDETRPFYFDKQNELYVFFFQGNCEPVIECVSGNPGGYCFESFLTLLILAISDTDSYSKAIGKLLNQAEKIFNQLFVKDYLTAKDRMHTWASFGYLDEMQKRYIYDEILPVVDKYVSSTISFKQRKQYSAAAMFLVGIAEAGVNLGVKKNRSELISFYLGYYKRYTAFTGAIRSLL